MADVTIYHWIEQWRNWVTQMSRLEIKARDTGGFSGRENARRGRAMKKIAPLKNAHLIVGNEFGSLNSIAKFCECTYMYLDTTLHFFSCSSSDKFDTFWTKVLIKRSTIDKLWIIESKNFFKLSSIRVL